MTRLMPMLLILSAGFLVGQAHADEPPSGDRQQGSDMKQDLQKVMQSGTPSEGHRALDPFTGSWDMRVRLWMQGPDKPPTEGKSTCKIDWVLDGRFLHEEDHSQLMGRPFTHIGYTGYDKAKKKYVSVWLDNVGTGIVTFEGTVDASGKVFTYIGQETNPISGKAQASKYVQRILSPDRHVLEIFDPARGDNVKTVEITYTRQK